jgi:hypothetical protein
MLAESHGAQRGRVPWQELVLSDRVLIPGRFSPANNNQHSLPAQSMWEKLYMVNSDACVDLLVHEIYTFTYVPLSKDAFHDVQITPS